MALAELTFRYVPQLAVKGQALADFLASHSCVEIEDMDYFPVNMLSIFSWRLYFDASRTSNMSGAGIIIKLPQGFQTCYSFQMNFDCSNNQAKYEALIIGLEIVRELGINNVVILGDSMPTHGQLGSGVQIFEGLFEELFKVEKRSLSFIFERGLSPKAMAQLTITPDDWRHEIISYLKAPNGPHSQHVRWRARCYVIGDEILFRIGSDDLLMKCLGKKEQLMAMMANVEPIKLASR
ncbi:hypothetical protein L3X38_011756 [Prunus dulcis]|uniref:RNase H type-1 domain-containing protein n=1 Tax=Prunus dulcis TaxID=3755 RepID=A0AAD4WI08_PRUDU|nr:hypothetical protein L3X38_011756 [Prunus dulcis]